MPSKSSPKPKRSSASKSKKSSPKKSSSPKKTSSTMQKLKANKKKIAAATAGLAALGLAGYAGYKKRDVIKSKAASGSAAAKTKASKLRQSMSDLMAKLMGKKSSTAPPAPAFGFAGQLQAAKAKLKSPRMSDEKRAEMEEYLRGRSDDL